MKSWRRSLMIAFGVISCGRLYELAGAGIPTKTLPAAMTGAGTRFDGCDWIKRPAEGQFPDDGTREVEDTDVYEVVASKQDVSVNIDLKDRTFVKLTSDDASRHTGRYFRCPRGKTPYLVRAIYGYGGTGRYVVERFGRKLHVLHGSLGTEWIANKSALVVNLDFELEDVYTDVAIAK